MKQKEEGCVGLADDGREEHSRQEGRWESRTGSSEAGAQSVMARRAWEETRGVGTSHDQGSCGQAKKFAMYSRSSREGTPDEL